MNFLRKSDFDMPSLGAGLSPRRFRMKNFFKLRRDSEGATAIEYGLIAALIAVAAITAMQGLGGSLKKSFNGTSSTMSNNSA